jgi:FixJ family two-component response regulator
MLLSKCYVSFVMETHKPQLVAIVDDDESIRSAVCRLLKSYGLEPRSFASAEEFLDSGQLNEIACLICDIRLSGMSGLELQSRLAQQNRRVAIILITAHGDPRLRAQAMKAGASQFLEKPFDDEVLIESIRATLDT